MTQDLVPWSLYGAPRINIQSLKQALQNITEAFPPILEVWIVYYGV